METQNTQKMPKSPKKFSLSVNPLLIVISVIVLIFAVISLLNATSTATVTPVSVNQLLNGIKQNSYSILQINNSGKILAQEKYIDVVQVSQDTTLDLPQNLKLFTEVDGLKTITKDELLNLFKPSTQNGASLLSVIGSTIRFVPSDIIFNSNQVILLNATESYVVNNFTEVEFQELLNNNNIQLDSTKTVKSKIASASKSLTIEEFKNRLAASQYQSLVKIGNTVYARFITAKIPTYSVDWDVSITAFSSTLQREGISLAAQTFEINSIISTPIPWGDLFQILGLLLVIGVAIFAFRAMQSSGSSLGRFGQSKARMFWGAKQNVTFADVAGIDEAREELSEIVQFLKNPDKFRKLGARIPKGVLMVGQPGTGKTLMARAIAGEAGVPFFHTSGSEFEEMLVGAGASRVRDLFEKAKKASPALIFIDEIDAVARKRGTTIQSSTTEQTLNQILVEMDGFEPTIDVIIIAATNRPDVLDPAILRPGRFDRRVYLDLPDAEGRRKILAIHSKNKPLADDVRLDIVAKRTIGFSGAELENTMNEAAIIAAKAGKKKIEYKDIEEAASKITMGPAKTSKKRDEATLKLVAYHEAGHAVVAKFTDQANPVHRVSIISRGMSGGVTEFLPTDENNITSKTKLTSLIAVSLGGRAAEEIFLGDVSTGASSDINQATNIARNMIQKYGMSKSLGLIKYGDSQDMESLGYGYGDSKDYSENTSMLIDQEVRELVNEAYVSAKKILNANKDKVDLLVKLLLEKEVVESEEFDKLFG